MSDYEPINITNWCTAGEEVLRDENPTLGLQTMRGLPFQVGSVDGSPNQRCYVSLHKGHGPVTIPIDKTAYQVVFAHRLLETQQPVGGHPGEQVAEYVFKLADGDVVRVPIRERYEINAVGDRRGVDRFAVGFPYLAVPDRADELISRDHGEWSEAGRRQTETLQAQPRMYYLWAWANPKPNVAIKSIEIISKDLHFIVAGVTLGYLDEHPFSRTGRRPVKVTLKEDADAEKAFDVEVTIDRGEATYTHSLPEQSSREFLESNYKGWGEPQNQESSPSYVELSGTSSATVTVNQGGNKIDSVSWGEIEDKGVAETDRVRVQLAEPGKNWVRVRVLDDDTGKPVPCRVHFRSPEGIPYQPHGHHNQVNSNNDTWHIDVGGDLRLGHITYAYIDGTCEGWLPRGDVIVDLARGYEYDPVRTKVTIEPGQQNLDLRIKRWTDMNAQGWYSGDSHVHFLSTQGSHFESQGEDVNVVNLLQSQWGSLFTNTEDFTGEPSVTRDGNNIVYTSQENRQHQMGHMILWGLKKPVMPWCSDGPSEGEIGGSMETTLSYWADQAHSQGAYVINPHFPHPNGEPAALVATGRLDGIEMILQRDFFHNEWYRYLNSGYKLPLVGGTDKMSSDVPVGLYRTYVRIPDDEEFTYENWCRNVAKGRTMLSGGPILGFTVDGFEVGDTLSMSSSGTVEVYAWAESVVPMSPLEIVKDGQVIASAQSSKPTRRLEIREKVQVCGNSWLAARAGGPSYFNGPTYYDVWQRGIFSHTSPIYIAVGGDWWMFDEATAKYMLTLIDGDLTYIENSSRQHVHGHVTHHHGEDDHIEYLKRPFIEARTALEERLRKRH